MTRLSSAEFDSHVGELRDALGRVDALADALQRTFDERVIDGDPLVVERRISHMIDMLAEASARALKELARAGDTLGLG